MPKDDNSAYDHNAQNLDEFAKQAAEWDQGLKALEQGGQMAAAMFKGLTGEGVTGFHAAVAVGTALQALYLNADEQDGGDG